MGVYQIGPRIAGGGMAEVHLGLHEAIGGFRKLVVMKRLLGWQNSDPEAVERLLAEARVAATINHPNVVTTLDIGRDDTAPYIVLEYLSGEDLELVLRHLRSVGARLPASFACRIGASVAAALHQAHDITLPDGSQQSIIHRDVTPSNIVICYSGVIKLVDFGVARVSTDARKTRAGTIKGKLSYLAPEQLTDAEPDARTDVFQLGIVLWEMLTMRRLFAGKSDYQRVNAVLNRPIPCPRQLVPSLPASLDATVMRALDRNPDGRFQTAHELEAQLNAALAELGDTGGDQSVGEWMRGHFQQRYEWRLELERRTLEELTWDENYELEVSESDRHDGAAGTGVAPRLATPSGTPTSGEHSLLRTIDHEPEPPGRRNSRRFWSLAVPAVVAAIAGLVWYARGGGESAPPPALPAVRAVEAKPAPSYAVEIAVRPATATISIDGELVGRGRFRGTFPGDGASHIVTLAAPDHETVQRTFDAATAIELELQALPEEPVAAAPEAAAPRPIRRHRSVARRSVKPTAKPRPPPPPEPEPERDKPMFEPITDNIDPF